MVSNVNEPEPAIRPSADEAVLPGAASLAGGAMSGPDGCMSADAATETFARFLPGWKPFSADIQQRISDSGFVEAEPVGAGALGSAADVDDAGAHHK